MDRLLNWLFPVRREALAEADELMETFGNEAYSVARKLSRDALLKGDLRKHKIYSHAERKPAFARKLNNYSRFRSCCRRRS